MIGAIAGDIIGSRFEGVLATPASYILMHHDCEFTDDTVCSLAVAEALIGDLDFAGALRRSFLRHPLRGYGGMFRQWALGDAGPYESWGNGAPMRTAAVGWLAASEGEALRLAKAQSEVTHNHPDAVSAAQAVTLAIYLLRQGESAHHVLRRIETEFGYSLPAPPLASRGFDVSASGTAPQALAAALHSRSWIEAVTTVIALGGDTDTLACIAGSIAEPLHGVPAEISTAARGHLTPDLLEILERFENAVSAQGA